MLYLLVDLYWVGVQDGNLPPAEVNVLYVGNNRVARARYGDAIVGGRLFQGEFHASLDGVHIDGIFSYEVCSKTCLATVFIRSIFAREKMHESFSASAGFQLKIERINTVARHALL